MIRTKGIPIIKANHQVRIRCVHAKSTVMAGFDGVSMNGSSWEDWKDAMDGYGYRPFRHLLYCVSRVP